MENADKNFLLGPFGGGTASILQRIVVVCIVAWSRHSPVQADCGLLCILMRYMDTYLRTQKSAHEVCCIDADEAGESSRSWYDAGDPKSYRY